MKRNFIITIIPIALISILGIYGFASAEFVCESQVWNTTVKWFIIPIILVGIFYGYNTTNFGRNKNLPIWRKTLIFLATSFLFSAFYLRMFMGILILINQKTGIQSEYVLRGKIERLNYPEKAKIANRNSIIIKRKTEEDSFVLDVPTNNYHQDDSFVKTMKIGSLGFIYSVK